MGEYMIAGFKRIDCAYRYRLFADVEMQEPANIACRVHLGALLLEAADQQHLAIEIDHLGWFKALDRSLVLFNAQRMYVLPVEGRAIEYV
jgi:hypothetical protein